MASRTVEIRIVVNDLDAVKKLDALSARLDKLKAKFNDLSKKVISPKIEMDGITKANAELDKLKRNLDAVGRKRVTAHVGVDVNSGRLRRDIAEGNRAVANLLDRRGANADNGRFSALFGPMIPFFASMAGKSGWAALLGRGAGGGGGAAGAAAAASGGGGGGGGGFASLAASPVGIAGIAAALPSIAALFDALVGQGIGTGVAGAGVLGARHFDPGQVNPGLAKISNALKLPFEAIAPSIGLMFANLGGFVKQNQGGIAKLFASSLPFLQQFINLAEIAAKTILPALTSAMVAMVKSGALKEMTQGFVFIIQGIAGFIKALGPGMKAGGLVFRAIAMGIRDVLIGLGKAFGWLGHFAGIEFQKVRGWWDKLRHNTAVIFDGIRHDTAHIWDMIYQDTIAKVVHTYQDVNNWEQRQRHNIANIYDGIRHDVASAWDLIWNNTVGRVERGVGDVETWFHKLPTGIQNALRGLGTLLESLAKLALNMMWSGFKSVGSGILHFFSGFGHSLLNSLKSVFGIASPSRAMFDIGRNLGLGLEHGLKSRYAPIKNVVSGLGGSVTSWIVAALHGAGKPMSWLPALQRLVSLESGGNPRAVNPMAVLGQHATGLWQMLPSTFASYGGIGSLFNPITEGIAALRYISARYGSPFNIPGLLSGGYQGYARGGIITEPIFGMGLRSGMKYTFGEHGIHERVTPLGAGGGGGGDVYNIYPPDSATNPDAYGLVLVKAIRRYKQHKGNAPLGIA